MLFLMPKLQYEGIEGNTVKEENTIVSFYFRA